MDGGDLAVNDRGDTALVWYLRDPSTSATSAHLLTLPIDGEQKIQLLTANSDNAGAHVALNSDGEGIVTWFDDVELVSYSQRFDADSILATAEQLGSTDNEVGAVHLDGNIATAFYEIGFDQAVSVNDGLSGWSVPLESSLSSINFAETYTVPDEGVYAITFSFSNLAYLFRDDEIVSVSETPLGIQSVYHSSNLTTAGNKAISTSKVEQGYPIYVRKSQVLPTNELPVADAGPDQLILNQDTMTLDGSGSTDEGVILEYSWHFLPAGETFTSSSAIKQLSIWDVTQATFEIELTVTDDRGGQSTDIVTVTVNNQYGVPIADLGAEQIVYAGEVVVLDYSGSYDPDGGDVTGIVSVVSGEGITLSAGASAQTVEFIAPQVTEDTVLTFEVTITDDEGDTATAQAAVTVKVPGIPSASAGTDQSVEANTTVTLDGSASTAPDGESITQYQWTQVSGTSVTLSNASTANAQFTAPDLATDTALVFQLEVTASNGETATDTVTITVLGNATTQLPIADFGPDQTVDIGDLVVLDYSGTTDPDGGSFSLAFSIVAGSNIQPVQNTQAQTWQFTAPSVTVDTVYIFRVVITDEEGDTASDDVSITVKAPSVAEPPVANASTDQSAEANTTVTLDGSASTAPDGESITQYQWTQVSGTSVTLSNASTASAQFTAPDLATDTALVFQLEVTASNGETATDTVTITVLANMSQSPVADFGTDQSVDIGDLVILDYSASYDPDGGNVTGDVVVVSGGSITLVTGTTPGTVEFTAPDVTVDTVYTFRVTITDDEGDTAFADVSVTVAAATGGNQGSLIDLSSTSAYASQDSANGSVQSSTNEITLTGNRWRIVDGTTFTVTADTVIEFDFAADGLGEVQGIGFDNDGDVNNGGFVFQLGGTQSFGYTGYIYTGGGAVQHFIIPAGQFITGDLQLVIINDKDANPDTSTLTISNVQVCETSC